MIFFHIFGVDVFNFPFGQTDLVLFALDPEFWPRKFVEIREFLA